MPSPTPRELLIQRYRQRTPDGTKADRHHLALVFEGGGMRGVVSIAMALAFEELGLLPLFDSVHGSSAGACGAAYFTAQQSAMGASIYYEDINNSNFINLGRVLRGQPIMNKDYLIDFVMRSVKPLDASVLIRKQNFLHVIATDCDTGEEVLFNEFKDAEALFRTLKASICLPLIAGHSIAIGHRNLVDGGLVQQIALKSAIDAGATHVIVLMTRKENELFRDHHGLAFYFEKSMLRLFYGPRLSALFESREERVNQTIDFIMSGGGQVSGRTVSIESVVRSAASADVGRLTTDGNLLRMAFEDGRAAARSYLGKMA